MNFIYSILYTIKDITEWFIFPNFYMNKRKKCRETSLENFTMDSQNCNQLQERYKVIFIEQKRKHEQLLQEQREELIGKHEQLLQEQREELIGINIELKQKCRSKLQQFAKDKTDLLKENDRLLKEKITQQSKYEKSIHMQYNLILQINGYNIPEQLKEILQKSISDLDPWS